MDNSKRLLIIRLGNILTLAGLAFVSFRLAEYSAQFELSMINRSKLLIFLALFLICWLSNILLILSWAKLLSFFGAPTTLRQCIKIYGLSQISKYIPGNVFYLISRQALVTSDGLPQRSAFKASIMELMLLVTVAAIITILILPLFFQTISFYLSGLAAVGLLGMLVILITYYLSSKIVYVVGFYFALLSILGGVFVAVLALTTENLPISISEIVLYGGAFIFAWLVGVLTPGSPAGIGVREFILLILLRDVVSEVDLLASILICRTLTVFSDIMFFLSVLPLKRQKIT